MAQNSRLVAEYSIIKFKDQDFSSLRDHCLSRRQLFEDETFPATASSIGHKLLQGKNLSRLKWKRPHVSEPPGTHPALGPLEHLPWCLPLKGGRTQNETGLVPLLQWSVVYALGGMGRLMKTGPGTLELYVTQF